MDQEAPRQNEVRPFGLILLAGAILAFVAWRLGLFGVAVDVSPPAGATSVSTATAIRLRFSAPVTAGALPAATVRLTPDVAGAITLDGIELAWTPAEPLAAATTYTVTVSGDLNDERGRAVRLPAPWTFTTRRLQVLFLAPDDGVTRLFAVDADGGAARALTPAGLEVVDFAVAPRGDRVVFSAHGAAGGQDLWLLDASALAEGTEDAGKATRWLDCAGDACGGASWAPDGRRLIFERREIDPDGAASPPRLWWAEPEGGETIPVFRDESSPGAAARISPDGRWLSYILPTDGSLRLVELATGAETAVVSRTGEPAAWSPDGRSLALSSVSLSEDGVVTGLLIVQLEGLETLNLSEGLDVTDGSAAWSSDGSWLAFTRGRSRVAAGKQLMRVRPDGSELEALTDDGAAQHGPPSWSPDGSALLFQRFVAGAQELPGIWLLDLSTGQLRELAPTGFAPAWLP